MHCPADAAAGPLLSLERWLSKPSPVATGRTSKRSCETWEVPPIESFGSCGRRTLPNPCRTRSHFTQRQRRRIEGTRLKPSCRGCWVVPDHGELAGTAAYGRRRLLSVA